MQNVVQHTKKPTAQTAHLVFADIPIAIGTNAEMRSIHEHR